ncbi:hypothetical protein C8R45DRAFT_1100314 [Mycena sanguinolenta]|nr:hypothetical protein C8R45DRAFT_1100314 [Mycena sanguinolenta]
MGAALSSLTTPKVHVVGLLAAPNLRANKERRRMAEDFAAFRDLFREARNAVWLVPAPEWSSESLDLLEPIVDDPHEQSPVTTVPLDVLEMEFLSCVRRAAEEARERDIIVIVLCGHGDVEPEETAHLVVGGPAAGEYHDFLDRRNVERALKEAAVPSERVFMLSTSTACCKGRWRSLSWTLLAAANSGSVQITAGTTSTCAAEGGEMQSQDDVYGLIECAASKPIRPVAAELLQRLEVVGPGEPIESKKRPLVIHPLSPEEKTLLCDLATAYNKVEHANTGIDASVNAKAKLVAHGKPLSSEKERILLECLRYQECDSRRATVIARELGWTSVIPVEEWWHGNGLEQMMKAEACGAAIATEFFLGPKVGATWWEEPDPKMMRRRGPRRYKTMGIGAWLADAWSQAGEPLVDVGAWQEAVRIANEEVGK